MEISVCHIALSLLNDIKQARHFEDFEKGDYQKILLKAIFAYEFTLGDFIQKFKPSLCQKVINRSMLSGSELKTPVKTSHKEKNVNEIFYNIILAALCHSKR